MNGATSKQASRVVGAFFFVAASGIFGCWPALDALTGGAPTRGEHDAADDARTADVDMEASRSDATTKSTYRDVVLADGPVAYWRLGESAGPTARDESPTPHAATYQGGVQFGARSALGADSDSGSAIVLDGATASVEIGTTLDLSDRTIFAEGFTIEAWIAPTQLLGNFRRILSKEDLTGAPRQGYTLYIDADDRPRSSAIWFERFVNGVSVDEVGGTAPVPLGVYTYVVVTFSAATQMVRMYLDGKRTSSAAHEGPAGVTTPFVGYWGRASIEDGPSNFAGSLDEVALYPKALDDAQIANHYAAARP